ncbi:hypothetical protein WN51_02083 [Melipona quadrifasciata]|uniref:Uncharacterized protein n=1 Tax=Melipona quadrifasciata TaxID=166423 RepID=A0A0N0BEY8_9HYME|nr:hypothetical protein WN51_02083 [Melipona quadrifasciata]
MDRAWRTNYRPSRFKPCRFFFLWNCAKEKVMAKPPSTKEDVKQNIKCMYINILKNINSSKTKYNRNNK